MIFDINGSSLDRLKALTIRGGFQNDEVTIKSALSAMEILVECEAPGGRIELHFADGTSRTLEVLPEPTPAPINLGAFGRR